MKGLKVFFTLNMTKIYAQQTYISRQVVCHCYARPNAVLATLTFGYLYREMIFFFHVCWSLGNGRRYEPSRSRHGEVLVINLGQRTSPMQDQFYIFRDIVLGHFKLTIVLLLHFFMSCYLLI